MCANETSGVVLQQVQTTTLYQPAPPAPGENLYFLRWETDQPPQQIPLEATWAESGPPPTSGYFLFLDAPPPNAPSFEQAIRKHLPAPTASAFAWAVTSTAAVQTLLKTKLDDSGRPCVDGDTQLSLLPGSQGVGFSDGSPVLAAEEGGYIVGFVVTYPPLTGAQSPSPSGVSLPMTGDFVGCVQFAGLTDALGGPGGGGESALKTLVNVSIDPHRPLDPERTYTIFTGENFILTQEDGGSYSIARAS
jgi:hypothetical protein